MRATFAPLIALLLSDAILLLGHGLLLTLLPITANEQGFSALEVALTGSGYFVGFVSGCVAAPYILRRVGHIRSFAVLAALYSSAVLILALNESFYAWVLLRFVMGATISGLYTIIESWLNDRSEPSSRGTVLSVYAVLNMLMIALGQQLLGFEFESNVVLFSIAVICICLAIVPVSLTLALAPAPVKNVKISLKKLWQQSHTGVMGALVAGLVTGAFWSLAPVYAAANGFSGTQIAAFMSATVIGGALFQLPIGKLSDHIERRLVLIYLNLLGVIMSIVFFVFSGRPEFAGWISTLCALVWGGLCTTTYAIALAHANDNAAADEFVEISSSMLLVVGASSAIGAPIASMVMTYMGPAGLYIYMASCSAIFTVTIVMRRQQHEILDVENAEGYYVVPNMTTPALFELAPRNEEAQQTPRDVDD